MNRPTKKATKAEWIAYADEVEAQRDGWFEKFEASQKLDGERGVAHARELAELRRVVDETANGQLVKQLRREMHRLKNGRR
jgi:hypothetical protein